MRESEDLKELEQFIKNNPEPRELKRALAVQMLCQGLKPTKIEKILGVSAAFISKYKGIYALEGVEGLKLKHKGSQGYLSKRARAEVVEWLRSQTQITVSELENHLEDTYGIRFLSKRSYYNLLKEAGLSWKKTQKKNPKRNGELIEAKQREICDLLEANRPEIESGKLVVYLIDECHLLWGDVCGYAWGIKSERLEISMINERDRATYYGALNYQSKQFIVKEYDGGNAKNTVSFLRFLKEINPESRLLIIWDGASYHKYKEMREYLQEINQELEASQREINCVVLAPNAPEQNPVEDVWLQAKNCLRKFWYKLSSFALVKWLFTFFLQNQIFEFAKLHKYGFFPKRTKDLSEFA